ncbi:MAG: T9SS type A sorting domain-containing protein [Candidatus Cloacimonetes bacterium]|nr:T9SS type A sorting domain-containing protein [Candidatus Cloacimonadota bacterium]
MRILLLILVVILPCIVLATTITVKQDGTGNYTLIQAAIEAANNGDTVLVHPGTYVENINYIGKSISVCSLEAIAGDSTYISRTIINGNRNGPCVAFLNAEQNASLRGFTLTNGTGYFTYSQFTQGGGVLISNTYMTGSSISLVNCNIHGNHAGMGVGVSSTNASLYLSGLNVHHNYGLESGGGILIVGSSTVVPSIVFDPVNRCSVYENYGVAPVDISVVDIPANITIYLNKASINPPSTFYIGRHNNLSSLQQYHDTVIAEQAHRTEINRDFYVSPNGDDNNSGISPDEPMRTITRAMHLIASDSLDVKTVHVLPGVYDEGEGEQLYPIPIKSHTNLIGAGSELVTLTSSSVCMLGIPSFIYSLKARHNTISGFTMTESVPSNRIPYMNLSYIEYLHLNDIVISDIQASEYGAFFMDIPRNVEINKLVIKNITTPHIAVNVNWVHDSKISNSTFTNIHSTYVSDDPIFTGHAVISFWVEDSFAFENNEISNISVHHNQGTFAISVWNPWGTEEVNIRVSNCLFDNIKTNNDRAVLFASNDYSNVEISNCTLYNNYGSDAAVGLIGDVSMRNNIFYNPDAEHEIVMYAPSQFQSACNLDVDYSYIRGGEVSINNTSSYNSLYYGEHNLSEGLLFAGTSADSGDYLRLAPGSPCINAGTPDAAVLSLLPYDLAGNWRIWDGRIDMGCYEFGSEPWVAIDDPVLPVPDQFVLMQNYPNPFNPSTTISYILPEASEITLSVYNLKGQLVRTLVEGFKPSGLHQVVWDGKDKLNRQASSGVYFIRLQSGKTSKTRKMLLMK